MILQSSSLKIAGGLTALCGVVFIYPLWSQRKPQRNSKSAPAKVSVTDKESGEERSILELLCQAKEREWIVAIDSGRYELSIGGLSISIDLAHEDDFDVVLSHRWEPILSSECGPVPVPMLRASYDRATWIDFLNHFNYPDHCGRVLARMGGLYATKHCRALFFEPGSEESALTAASRAWMWQELSLGPQQHTYSNLHALWVHHAVTEGDMTVYDSITHLNAVSITLVNLVLNDCNSPLRGGKSEGVVSWWRRAFAGVLAGCAVTLEGGLLELVPVEVAPSEAIVREYEAGNLHGVLAGVIASPQHFGDSAEARECVDALVSAAAGCGESTGAQVLAVARMLNDMRSTLAECAKRIFKARKRQDSTIEMYGTGIGMTNLVSVVCVGRTTASLEVARRAMRMMWRRSNGSQLSSAIANLGNHNITFDADRFAASFAVLCAVEGVPCEADAVSELIYASPVASVCCIPAAQSCAVGAATRKTASVGTTCWRATSGIVDAVLIMLFLGQRFSRGVCDELRIGELRLRNCPVSVISPPWWSIGTWGSRWWGDGRRGHVIHYSLAEHGLEDITMRMDNGDLLEMCELGAAECGVTREMFTVWHRALEAAAESGAGASQEAL